jgi:hypothetical protein
MLMPTSQDPAITMEKTSLHRPFDPARRYFIGLAELNVLKQKTCPENHPEHRLNLHRQTIHALALMQCAA